MLVLQWKIWTSRRTVGTTWHNTVIHGNFTLIKVQHPQTVIFVFLIIPFANILLFCIPTALNKFVGRLASTKSLHNRQIRLAMLKVGSQNYICICVASRSWSHKPNPSIRHLIEKVANMMSTSFNNIAHAQAIVTRH